MNRARPMAARLITIKYDSTTQNQMMVTNQTYLNIKNESNKFRCVCTYM